MKANLAKKLGILIAAAVVSVSGSSVAWGADEPAHIEETEENSIIDIDEAALIKMMGTCIYESTDAEEIVYVKDNTLYHEYLPSISNNYETVLSKMDTNGLKYDFSRHEVTDSSGWTYETELGDHVRCVINPLGLEFYPCNGLSIQHLNSGKTWTWPSNS